jgi:Fic family protein
MEQNKFYTHIGQFEPLLIGEQRPAFQELIALASELIAQSTGLDAFLPARTKQSVAQLVAGMNCYYSNLIEGDRTLPLSIEKALRRESEPESKQAQHQSLAHAHISAASWAHQQQMNQATSLQFILELHKRFCEAMPYDMLMLESGETMQPGKWRDVEVTVGKHVAPLSECVPRFIDRYAEVYGQVVERAGKSPFHKLTATVSVFCAHHRLVWIHPFPDGNGRVSRIVLDNMLRQIGVNEAGLWSMSRGFEKQRKITSSTLHWQMQTEKEISMVAANCLNRTLLYSVSIR